MPQPLPSVTSVSASGITTSSLHGSGVGDASGGFGVRHESPQSAQSVPTASSPHLLETESGPPSSQKPSAAHAGLPGHSLVQTQPSDAAVVVGAVVVVDGAAGGTVGGGADGGGFFSAMQGGQPAHESQPQLGATASHHERQRPEDADMALHADKNLGVASRRLLRGRNLLLVVAADALLRRARAIMPPRLRAFYETIVRKDLLHQLRYKNVHQVPQIEHVAVSMATRMRPGTLDHPVPAAWMLELLTGQRARLTKTRRNNARYKIRQGTLEGAMVKLHGDSMYEFVDRLLTQVLPRVTDFRGLRPTSFDGRGNYALGIKDVSAFLEIDAQHANLQRPPVHTARGVGIYVQTTAKTDDEARVLLSALRFPFLKYK